MRKWACGGLLLVLLGLWGDWGSLRTDEVAADPASQTGQASQAAPAGDGDALLYLQYEKTGETITITGCKGEPAELVIPPQIDGLPVTTIGKFAFRMNGSKATRERKSLKSVTLPLTLTTIEEFAFAMCVSLKSITIPKNVTSIGQHAFGNCRSLTTVKLPAKLTAIEKYTFHSCRSLKSVALPANLNVMGERAFAGCQSLPSVVLPGSLCEIGTNPFMGCDKLASIKFASKSPHFQTIDGVLFSGDGKRLISYPNGKKEESYRIRQGVTTIEENAFAGCLFLTSAAFPESLTTIKQGAFWRCYALTSVTFPPGVSRGETSKKGTSGGVASIGESAFAECGLKSIELPKGLTTLEKFTFSGCAFLESVTIPDSLQEIKAQPFHGCIRLAAIRISPNHRYFQMKDDALLSADGKRLVCVPCGQTKSSYEIPKGVAAIGAFAFIDNENLKSVTFPEGITTIEESAFMGCRSLESAVFPEGVITIGDRSFWDCSSLKSITFPESLTTIGMCAFLGCGSVESLTFLSKRPAEETAYEENAFDNCPRIKTISGQSGSAVESLAKAKGIEFIAIDASDLMGGIILNGNHKSAVLHIMTGENDELGDNSDNVEFIPCNRFDLRRECFL